MARFVIYESSFCLPAIYRNSVIPAQGGILRFCEMANDLGTRFHRHHDRDRPPRQRFIDYFTCPP